MYICFFFVNIRTARKLVNIATISVRVALGSDSIYHVFAHECGSHLNNFSQFTATLFRRVAFVQYIPKKALKLGIKVWVNSEAKSGYVLDLQVYTGTGRRVVILYTRFDH